MCVVVDILGFLDEHEIDESQKKPIGHSLAIKKFGSS
jgi:hypothetical protein